MDDADPKSLSPSEQSKNETDELTAKLLRAARSGRYEPMLELIEAGAKVNGADKDGNGPLHLVAQSGLWPRAARLLIEKGANVNARNKLGETPLHMAAESKPRCRSFSNVIYELVNNGADVFAVDKNGELPRDKAAARGNEQVVESLEKRMREREKTLTGLPESELVKRRENIGKVASMLDAELQRRAKNNQERGR